MYHLSGDEQTVMYLWFAMAAVSAILFRSGVVAAVAGFLSWASFAVYLDGSDMRWMRSIPGWRRHGFDRHRPRALYRG
jgi:uncharacterized membrane protein